MAAAATSARDVRITGRVQGVCFRAWTKQQADVLGVTGWVRNRPDGSVEAFLCGADSAVGQLIDLMRSGPPGAAVDRLDAELAVAQHLTDFSIRRD